MLTSEKEALLAKYEHKANGHFGMSFAEACADMNLALDAAPVTSVAQAMRGKYASGRQAADIMFWIVSDDILATLKNVVPFDPPELPAADVAIPSGGNTVPCHIVDGPLHVDQAAQEKTPGEA